MNNIRYAGLALDNSRANPQPDFYVDISESGMDSPTEQEIEVPSALGMSATKKRSGPYMPAGNIVYNTDIRTIGRFIKWGLMGYAFTAAPPVSATDPTPTNFHTHEFWANDVRDLQEFCARIGKDEFEHVFEGCIVNSLELAVERELVPFTVDVVAARDFEDVVKNVATDIYPNLPEEYALAYHDIKLRIDKDNTNTMIDVSSIANSLTTTVENNVDSEAGVTLGSRFPRRHVSGGRNVALSAELQFRDMAQKRKFWGDVVPSSTRGAPGKLGGKTFPVEAYINSGDTFVTGNYGDALMRFPKCYYQAVPLSPSGREEMTQGVEIATLGDTVTLLDGTTKVVTPFYMKLRNRQSSLVGK